MQSRPTYTLKNRLAKQIALLVSICYFIHPLYQPLNDVLHHISHSFELPAYVLSHKSPSAQIHDHIVHSHHEAVVVHEHTVIDFIGTIFKASHKEEPTDDSQPDRIKWNKHLTYCQLEIPPYFELIFCEKIDLTKRISLQNCITELRRPPQNRLS